MKKLSIELGRVSKGMRLKFSLILDSQDSISAKRLNLINHFQFNGNDYIRLNPHPFITIDISDSFDKGEEWTNGKSVNLNMAAKMKIESRLQACINNFQIKNLFYYREDKLIVNRDISKRLEVPFVVGNKTCFIRYAVIPDDKNVEIEYEGVIFMINSADNFCYLTLDEVGLLFYTLRNINMYELSISLLTYYETFKDSIESDIVEIEPKLILEKKEDIPEPNHVPEMENPLTIPDL